MNEERLGTAVEELTIERQARMRKSNPESQRLMKALGNGKRGVREPPYRDLRDFCSDERRGAVEAYDVVQYDGL
ncbi:hypothetical protein TBR22_A47150 [Luteitalea sp. TBR-22]|nr:hypothetical protein TBR22_A47150 [Luteitalea sp. TBR-22]